MKRILLVFVAGSFMWLTNHYWNPFVEYMRGNYDKELHQQYRQDHMLCWTDRHGNIHCEPYGYGTGGDGYTTYTDENGTSVMGGLR